MIVGGKMHIDRTNLKHITSKAVDFTVDATEAVLEQVPVVATKVIQRSAPYISKGAKVATKITFDTLYKLAFK